MIRDACPSGRRDGTTSRADRHPSDPIPQINPMRRVLFVSCYVASDFQTMVWGPFIRMSMLLEAASRVATSVDLMLFAAEDMLALFQPPAIADSIERAWGIRVNVILAPRARSDHSIRHALRGLTDVHAHPDYRLAGGARQAAAVRAAIRPDTDLVIAQKLEAALSVAACGVAGVATLMDIDDVEHVSHARRTRQRVWSLGKALALVRQASVKRGELATINAFATAFVCSETDRARLTREGVIARIEVVPNAMQFVDRSVVLQPAARTIVYFGSYAYQPNVDAAEELINNIFPRVLARCPDARLLIAGAFAEKLPSFSVPKPSVDIVGFVDDPKDVYQHAALACCPIRAGSGTRIKIIEASAWKIPTVATPLAAEGLDLHHDTEILLADEPEQLAAHCVALLEDPALVAAIGHAAWIKAKASFDRTAVVERIVRMYVETADVERQRTGHRHAVEASTASERKALESATTPGGVPPSRP